ncbi:MAG: metal-dependent transcriptional regulator [Chitinophagaceae bacterium]|nr:metal-dependent transcriptional regulator [Chitinophagaceae bacterium]MCO5241196.1 metal-dependent transcriptional regulator [Chitinophagaceae bacterium]
MNYSTSEEDYIKAIYRLQENQSTVGTNELAAELKTKPASITDMLKKLKAKKLLHYQPYRGFRLNEEGTKVALTIIRRHRLWEYFLSEKLKFGWNEVHDIAEELEHVGSHTLIERLDKYLGFPRFDPHGDPIPDPAGKLQVVDQIKLTELPLDVKAKVSGVTDQSANMLELLKHRHIAIGTSIVVKKKFDFDQSVEIKTDRNSPFTISEQAAKNIYVQYEPRS